MKLKAALVGDLQQVVTRELRVAERAIGATLRQASEGLKTELRQQVVGAGLCRGLANAWRARRFPANGESLGAAALIWSRAPQLVQVFEQGATIRARLGRYLAIPTNFNLSSGRRRSGREGGGNVRVTPAEMVASRLAFTRKRKDGPGLLWFLRVTAASEKTAKGRVKMLAIAGGIRVGGREQGVLIGGRRRARIEAALKAGAVPMFILLPQVTLRKRLDAKGAAERWAGRLPALLAQNWTAEAGQR